MDAGAERTLVLVKQGGITPIKYCGCVSLIVNVLKPDESADYK